jgi:nucleotide-binding universal stress UspA family protein
MLERIVVPLDGVASSERAIGVALALAKRANATVELLSVIKTGIDVWDRGQLSDIAEQFGGIAETNVVIETDSVEGAILEHAAGAERLICMASAGHGAFAELIAGSVSESVIRRTTKPVVLVGPNAATRPDATTLVVALDGSSASESILQSAEAMAAQLGLTLLLVSVHPPLEGGHDTPTTAKYHGHEYLKRVASRFKSTSIPVAWEVLHSRNIVRGLADYSRRDDVVAVAMATHGPGYLERLLLGGITFQVIKHAMSPVLTVYAPIESPSAPLARVKRRRDASSSVSVRATRRPL